MNTILPLSLLFFLEEKLIQSITSPSKLFAKENHPSPSNVLKMLPAYKLTMTFLEAAKAVVEQGKTSLSQGKAEKGEALVLKGSALFATLKNQPQLLQKTLQVVLKQLDAETTLPSSMRQLVPTLKADLQLLQTLTLKTPPQEVQKVLAKVAQNLTQLPQSLLKEAVLLAKQTVQQQFAQQSQTKLATPAANPTRSEQTVVDKQAPAQSIKAEQLELFQKQTLERAAAPLIAAAVVTATPQPQLQQSTQLPLAFVVPYTATIKSETRPEKSKRKKFEEEEILDEEEEEEKEASF